MKIEYPPPPRKRHVLYIKPNKQTKRKKQTVHNYIKTKLLVELQKRRGRKETRGRVGVQAAMLICPQKPTKGVRKWGVGRGKRFGLSSIASPIPCLLYKLTAVPFSYFFSVDSCSDTSLSFSLYYYYLSSSESPSWVLLLFLCFLLSIVHSCFLFLLVRIFFLSASPLFFLSLLFSVFILPFLTPVYSFIYISCLLLPVIFLGFFTA